MENGDGSYGYGYGRIDWVLVELGGLILYGSFSICLVLLLLVTSTPTVVFVLATAVVAAMAQVVRVSKVATKMVACLWASIFLVSGFFLFHDAFLATYHQGGDFLVFLQLSWIVSTAMLVAAVMSLAGGPKRCK